MHRAWWLTLPVLLTAICLAPRPLPAQFNDAARSRNNAGFRESSGDSTSFAAEPVYQTEARSARKITPSSRAAADGERGADGKPKPASATHSLWTSFGSLAIVVIVILLIGRTLKKHGPRISGGIPSEAVEVLGKRSLDARQSLHLVRLGSRVLLLGSSQAGLRTLAEVTDPVDVDYLAGVCRQSDNDGSAAQTFRSLFNRNTASQSDAAPSPHASGELRLPTRGTSTASRSNKPELEEAHG